jgi:hypothetical protein
MRVSCPIPDTIGSPSALGTRASQGGTGSASRCDTRAHHEMNHLKPDYELPIEGVAWTRGSGHPAGIYLHQGRVHFAALGSPAAEALDERGALHVANVRFDAPAPVLPSSTRIVRLDARSVLARFAGGG